MCFPSSIKVDRLIIPLLSLCLFPVQPISLCYSKYYAAWQAFSTVFYKVNCRNCFHQQGLDSVHHRYYDLMNTGSCCLFQSIVLWKCLHASESLLSDCSRALKHIALRSQNHHHSHHLSRSFFFWQTIKQQVGVQETVHF